VRRGAVRRRRRRQRVWIPVAIVASDQRSIASQGRVRDFDSDARLIGAIASDSPTARTSLRLFSPCRRMDNEHTPNSLRSLEGRTRRRRVSGLVADRLHRLGYEQVDVRPMTGG